MPASTRNYEELLGIGIGIGIGTAALCNYKEAVQAIVIASIARLQRDITLAHRALHSICSLCTARLTSTLFLHSENTTVPQ